MRSIYEMNKDYGILSGILSFFIYTKEHFNGQCNIYVTALTERKIKVYASLYFLHAYI